MKTALVAIYALAIFVTSGFGPAIARDHGATIKLAQQGDVMTASAEGTTQSFACSSATNMARNLCMVRGFNNIFNVKCECAQNDQPGALPWNCTGMAACQK